MFSAFVSPNFDLASFFMAAGISPENPRKIESENLISSRQDVTGIQNF